jgi:hypothetical protein
VLAQAGIGARFAAKIMRRNLERSIAPACPA